MKRFLELLRSLQALVGVVFLVALAVALFLAWRGPSIEEGSVLVVDLQGAYVEAPEPALATRLLRLGRRGPASMLGLVGELEKAGRDDRLAAVVLRIRDLEIGWGKAQELRGAVARLRERGRRTVAYLETEGFASNVEYYVASAADEVYAPPGVQAPVGLAAEYFFLGGLWEKAGIEIHAERIGRYKTFADLVTAEDMPEAWREMAESILDSVSGQYASDVEARRELGAGGFEAVLADPAAPPEALVERGVLDGVASLEAILSDELGDPPRVDAATYRQVDPERVGMDPVGRVAVVYASGPVVVGEATLTPLGGPVLASETVSKALREASEDAEIDAIVLRIDSPGGSALASEIVWQAVRRAAQARPVVVSFSDVAASGGYYVASGADVVVSHPATLTGSIGVVSLRPAVGGLLEELGIGFAASTRGPHADLLLGTRLPSEASLRVVAEGVETVYRRFVERVATGRSLEPDRVDALGQGRVWTGAQAAERGLVDALGGFHEALARAKHAAGLAEDEDVRLVPYPRPPSLLEQITGGVTTAVRHALVDPVARRLARDVPAWAAARDLARGAAAVGPGRPALVPPVAVGIR